MRIAFTGTHRAGKSTLVEAVAAVLPDHDVVDEPYRLLEEEGYEHADPPSLEDFEHQLRRSLEALAEAGPDALFDRCPLDLLAYLQALDDAYDVDAWLDDVRAAVATLELIVVVPIEAPDRIAVAAHEDRRLRRDVDDRVRALVLDDPYDLGVATLEVHGGVDERVAQVLRAARGT